MYEQFYGLTANPFQLRPDPNFFFGSKGHKRATSYLEYGLLREEGFIVITGEVGAGKTTLLQNIFRKLPANKIVAAQIVNTYLDSEDILRMVLAAFGLPHKVAPKATLLARIEKFLHQCDEQGKRALLVVDEAQNLTPQAIEELRMLSNFQTADKSLLQTFLIGQPEFRKTLFSDEMKQLKQRVIATYHLGPMDVDETRAYIEHRLHTVNWKSDPKLSAEAFATIYDFTGGIPRKINALCDRLLLMGCLEGLHFFGKSEVDEVAAEIAQEFSPPIEAESTTASAPPELVEHFHAKLQQVDNRLAEIEQSVTSILELLKQQPSKISLIKK